MKVKIELNVHQLEIIYDSLKFYYNHEFMNFDEKKTKSITQMLQVFDNIVNAEAE